MRLQFRDASNAASGLIDGVFAAIYATHMCEAIHGIETPDECFETLADGDTSGSATATVTAPTGVEQSCRGAPY
ncbi:hypothetical protein GCM10009021_22120 [Halarchaeum nitratireducens]|uniref:Uncharacterized protein n=1 Tax=Halarchaeum nitratireducens TaxID=489913 RepID=A0A830GCS3_9EURY|nr:hypothetical protein GCM10009021_22120 [Halarchaeum nitratireducens]